MRGGVWRREAVQRTEQLKQGQKKENPEKRATEPDAGCDGSRRGGLGRSSQRTYRSLLSTQPFQIFVPPKITGARFNY